MKILYDHLCFWEKYGGVPRYFVELMKRIPPELYIETVKFSNNEYLKELPQIHYYPFLKGMKFKRKARLESEFGKLFSIPYLIRGNFDIYHQTHYDPYAYKYLSRRIKTVTTIHDMNFYAIPEYYSKSPLLKRHMEISIKRADKIITISKNSKKDICNYLNIPEDKITVIYHGIDLNKFSKKIDLNHSLNPYILYVGSREKYKNFNRLLEAFSIIREKYPDLWLVCVGNSPSKTEVNAIAAKELIKVVKFIQASDDELIYLYKNALLFVFPSLYEGFGLPILEAMAARCPLALSNASCFPEIALDAASYFDPKDIDSMALAIERILQDEQFRKDIISKGAQRVTSFSWEKSVEQHLDVYKSILQQ